MLIFNRCDRTQNAPDRSATFFCDLTEGVQTERFLKSANMADPKETSSAIIFTKAKW